MNTFITIIFLVIFGGLAFYLASLLDKHARSGDGYQMGLWLALFITIACMLTALCSYNYHTTLFS